MFYVIDEWDNDVIFKHDDYAKINEYVKTHGIDKERYVIATSKISLFDML